ncbi:hypothetical protein TL16_g06544 [Triparma laevis f. inornata]|uniref:Kinesin-like protein n=1 Tax=Triparma laevis f. inornata TaxID=1714386 RepID=A0A9W7AN73_9STRA|nr:hypothetical protein TL16_g06544 [Triparma laevis f. inornata]
MASSLPPSRAPSPAPSSTPSVQVFCRFRPQNSIENSHAGVNCVKSNQTSCTVMLPNAQESDPEQIFTFDRVFAPNSTQEEIFDKVVSSLVDDSLNGYNCTVIAYGQTGSGKTHTMEGPPNCDFSDPESGVLPRVATKLFSTVANRRTELKETAFECAVTMSVIEIYLEKIVDLLDTSSPLSKKNGDSELLRIREDTSGSVYLEGVVEHVINDPSGLLKCLGDASQKRSTGAHSMNARSSRSHLVAIITITQKTSTTGTTSGKLYICDLAGSETVRKTGAGGKRLKEAQAINRSLSALGNVIKALTPVDNNNSSNPHVPYRDSKLTRLLQDSLGGNAKTALIVTCSVSSYNVSETMSTLRFGNRAKRMRNKAKVNKKMSYDELMKLIKRLEKENALYSEQVEVLERENRKLADARGGIRGVRNVQRENNGVGVGNNNNDSDESDDDEGVGAYLPNDDSDLKVDEEKERLEAELKRLKLLIETMESSNLTEEELRKKKDDMNEEERRKLSESLKTYKEESLNQYTKGWQVGQRAASMAYNNGNSDFDGGGGGEDEDKKDVEEGEEGEEGGQLQIKVDEDNNDDDSEENAEESFCQICGLGETETKDHEDVDNNRKLGPMFNCDGNCSSFFHTSCVGLSCLPTGEWFCAECGEVNINDPLPSPMRVEHNDFDQAAAASLAELSAVRGRFIALRKQRDRLISRWKGERESQRRVEGAKRKLRKKREEEICRLREVVLVLQEEVDMSEEDRQWLMQVMDSTVAFSPSRMKRGRGKGRGGGKGGEKEEEEVGVEEKKTVVASSSLTLDIQPVEETLASNNSNSDEAGVNHAQNLLTATSTELSSVLKQFESAKLQILKQQRQLQKYQTVIQNQQSTLSGLKTENSELLSAGKAEQVLESSPFGPLNSSSLPSSPSPDSVENVGEAFKTMKTWWAGELEDSSNPKISKEEGKPPLSPPKTSGVVKANAANITAPFRNRLIGLLSSIEKEAKDYNDLKDRIKVENLERRDVRNLSAVERRQKRLEEKEMSKTVPLRSGSFNDLEKAA